MRAKPKKSGVVIPHQPSRFQRLAAWLVFIAMRGLMLTFRYRWNDPADLFSKPPANPVIFAVWHNRLALSMQAHRVYQRNRQGPGLAALVSASKDGGFLAGILRRFKVQPVRGSSSRRGAQALLELTTWAERGYDLAITPDGPRGPCYAVQDGVMSLAQVTGIPVLPFSYRVRWKICMRSWDRFQIPLPFSKCEMNVGQLIHVPREATDEQRDALRLELQKTLNDLSGD